MRACARRKKLSIRNFIPRRRPVGGPAKAAAKAANVAAPVWPQTARTRCRALAAGLDARGARVIVVTARVSVLNARAGAASALAIVPSALAVVVSALISVLSSLIVVLSALVSVLSALVGDLTARGVAMRSPAEDWRASGGFKRTTFVVSGSFIEKSNH